MASKYAANKSLKGRESAREIETWCLEIECAKIHLQEKQTWFCWLEEWRVCELFYWLLLFTRSGLLYRPMRLTSLGATTIRPINRCVTNNIGAGVVRVQTPSVPFHEDTLVLLLSYLWKDMLLWKTWMAAYIIKCQQALCLTGSPSTLPSGVWHVASTTLLVVPGQVA